MKSIMKILHIASFSGNIGDEANHLGFRKKFKENICDDVEFHEIEIRHFYQSWGLEHFDDNFAIEANKYDLIIFGGGNFFEICWDYSSNATTIDITTKILEKIHVPILFNALGFDDGKGVCEDNVTKFGDFLNYLLEHPSKYLLSVRNDGSKKLLTKYYESKIVTQIHKVPDGGFFFKPDSNFHPIPNTKNNVGICLACDMDSIRFGNGYDRFLQQMSEFINGIIKHDDKSVVFYPHIYSDIKIISDVLALIKDIHRRNNVVVAPLLNTKNFGAHYLFESYKKCELIIGMRFHSNVCAIGNTIPTIGLTSYHKHGMLYEELGMIERTVQSIDANLLDKINVLYKNTVDNSLDIRKQYEDILVNLNNEIDSFHNRIKSWL
ncbi:hypothetical protein GC105_03125 [Alkalibaculum sp. M08DMB]|uniref:Polysaccharide pyruvyl transferase domain-containing protein n=1 Tax=Alkalibaculum sporogenes TaxID=2655001 RepID=A0A6A7K5X7_9FIRM|nr:polysaccharide pyruvyl transferase family protein [Alkalibaculum sporogenes]MPW24782.1 hypothetical protein [Alkalibaculum sporogenes]